MAGKPIGTIFVELDLDASRYTKGQRQLLQDAQSTSTTLEKNFQNLGIKSAGTFDLMRAKIQNSFEAISNSSKATANDIVRAEEAKNAKLRELNDQQFGAQTSALDMLKKHWLVATAAIYAAVRGVDQAIQAASTGALLSKQEEAFGNLARAAKTSSDSMITSLKAASRGMISESQLMAASGKALLMSIPAAEISKLMEIAAATSRMTGQTMTEAFNDITLGVARQSRMILDNLGLIISVEKANEDYAKALKKTADDLTDAEKRQAFMNATLKAGEDMIRRLGAPQGSIDGVSKATAEWEDTMAQLAKRFAEESNPLFEAVASVLKRINMELKAGAAASKEYFSSIENIDARIEELNKKHGDMQNRREWGYNEPPDMEYRRLVAERERLFKAGTSDLGRGRVGRYGATFEPVKWVPNRMLDVVPPDYEQQFRDYMRAYEERIEFEKKATESSKQFWEQYNKSIGSAFEFERFKLDAQLKEFDKYVTDKAALARWHQKELENIARKERESIEKSAESAAYRASGRTYANADIGALARSIEDERAAMEEADKIANQERWWLTYIADTEDAARANEIFADTMDIASQNIADAFVEFATGTEKASVAFQKMIQSMLSAWLRLMAQKQFEQLFGMLVSGGGGLLSGFFGGGGETPTGMTTNTSNSWTNWTAQTSGNELHSGGVGSAEARLRSVPSAVFLSAPRFHNGLAPDEMAAIIRKDEGVFTPAQMKALGRGRTSITVPVSVVEKDPKMHSELRREIERTVEKVVKRYS